MSNAKYRKAAGGPETGRAPGVPEALLGQGLTEEPTPKADPEADNPMPDKLARRLLANGAILMNHIANLCGNALDAIPQHAADEKFAREVMREAQQLGEQGSEDKPKRIKRAQPYALAGLMRIAISALRLMETMLQATNPNLFVPKQNAVADAFKAQKAGQELHENLQTQYAT